MIRQRLHILLIALVCTVSLMAQQGMNRPYADDKLLHFGFSLGLNFMAYSTSASLLPQSGMLDNGTKFEDEVFHTRTSQLFPGFSAGFIMDLRLARYLNLRFTPELMFGERTLTYRTESGNLPKVTTDVLCLPISMPVTLKWSAAREGNYRPYVIAGGGVIYDFSRNREKYILQRPFDYFVQVGAGCDFYFPWFKLCPEIHYQIGFGDVLIPTKERPELSQPYQFYTNSISKMHSHVLSLVFNFE